MGSTAAVTFDKDDLATKLCTNLDKVLETANANIKKVDLKATVNGNNEKIAEVFVDLVKRAIVEVKRDYVPREDFNKLQEMFNTLNDKFEAAQKRWEVCANQLDNVAQYSRRDNIKIVGIEPKTDEDVEQIVIDVAKDAGIEIKKDDISIAHRINTRGDATNNNETNIRGKPKKIPSIIARIKSRKLRNEIFLARKTLHENTAPTHTGARIYDDVTPLRSRILYALRNRKLPGTETKKYKFVWSREGRIFARTEEESKMRINRNGKDIPHPPHIINNPQDLKDLGWSPEEILDIIDNKVVA